MGSMHPAKASLRVAFSPFLSPPLFPLVGAAKTPVPTCSVCWGPTPGAWGERLHTPDRKWGGKEPLHLLTAFDEAFLCSGHAGGRRAPRLSKSPSWVTPVEHPALLEAVVSGRRSKPQTSRSLVLLQGGLMLPIWSFRIVLGARLSLVRGGDNGVKASLEHVAVSVFHTRMPAPSRGLDPGPTLLLGPFQCQVVRLQQPERAGEVQLKVMPSPKGALIRTTPAVAISCLVHLPLFQIPLLNLGLKPLFAPPFFPGTLVPAADLPPAPCLGR